MKALLAGGVITLLFLIYAVISRQWQATDNAMLIVGAVTCFFALALIGGRSDLTRMQKYERKVFHRIAWVLGAVGIPNLVASVVIYYSMH